MERLQKQLEEERLDRQREVAELERRNVAAKDKLKSEMFEKIKETKTVWRRHGGAFCVRACVSMCVTLSPRCVPTNRIAPPAPPRIRRAFCWPLVTSCTTPPSALWWRTSR